MDIIKAIEHEQMKSKVPVLKIGDTVKVHIKIKEGNRERIQVFEGIVIKKQNGGINETFTVRKLSYGIGAEKTFLIHSPNIEKIEVVRVGKTRRAKLYYLRDRVGKSAKTREKLGAKIETVEKQIKEEISEEILEEVKEVEATVVEVEVETKAEEVKEVEAAVVEAEAKPEEVKEIEATEVEVEAKPEDVKEEAKPEENK